MATTMKSDELNKITQEQVVEKRNILDIDTYFDQMYLTKSEKKERKELAKAIFLILSAILTIIKATEKLEKEHDIDYYKKYVKDGMDDLYYKTFGSAEYSTQVNDFANEFIENTMRNIPGSTKTVEYFTSDDRATLNAENQSNAVYNKHELKKAKESGKTRKTWVTMHDKRVRKSHVEADGQDVAIDEPFLVGISLLDFPCDPTGAYKEICGCRCTCIYY